MTWPCFWTERTDRAIRSLRRYSLSDSEHGYCSASVPIGEHELVTSDDFEGALGIVRPAEYEGDERWPTNCADCGRLFATDFDGDGISRLNGQDNWQVNQEPIYQRADTGERWPMKELPPGAMFDAEWNPDAWTGPDGISLAVMLPLQAWRHPWLADGPSSSGGHWSRTGDPRNPPTLTVTPSIFANSPKAWPDGYHGFLQNGILTDPL